ncbi:MAG: hypothetical protein ACTSP9_04150 [Promethearchaeota archaeon]
MIDQIISYCVIYVIISFSLIHWTNKKELDKPKYLSLLISLVLVILVIPFYYFFEPTLALIIAYFIDAFLGAFLISKIYKANFIDALRFFSWFIFGLFFLFYFVLLAFGFIIFWIVSLFV